MKLEIIILSKVNQKKTQMKPMKHKQNHGHRERMSGCQEGGCMGGVGCI